MGSNVWSILGQSIKDDDAIIGYVAVFTLIIFVLLLISAYVTSKQIKKWKIKRNKDYSKGLYRCTSVLLSLFTTLISIFPLLGMLGTVFGLLGLDLATGDMENIKANFFVALTSTAWGIIFSAGFKLIYSLVADYVDEQIETAKKLSDV